MDILKIRNKETMEWSHIPAIIGPKGDPGSDANVTAENIESALGYTPASSESVNQLKQDTAQLEQAVFSNYTLVNDITLSEEVSHIFLSETSDGDSYNFRDVIILSEAPNKDNPVAYIILNGIAWAGGLITNSARYHYLKISADGGRNRFEYAYGNDSSSRLPLCTLLQAMGWHPIDKIRKITIVKLAGTNFPAGMTFKVYAR